MVDKILHGVGIPYTETRFITPPKADTFAVYLDEVEVRGGDGVNLVKEHSVSLEIYENYKDPETESKIEANFDAYGIEYTKVSRYWIDEEQLYQVIYEFNYISKGV